MTLETPSNIIDAAGYVAIDIPCRQCGYNVRGLPYTGRCPECGIPVAISLHEDLLRFSKPEWLFMLNRGVNIIIGGMILGTLMAMMAGMARTVPVLTAIGCFMGIAGLAILVFGIMYLLMLEKLGKAFKAQAVLARDLWNTLDPAAPQ